MTTTLDLTFGIKEQALEIAKRLKKKLKLDNAIVMTFPFYNGRERGIGFSIYRYGQKNSLIVTFGECRNSDSIYIDAWEIEKILMNPPTVADFTEEAYTNRRYVVPEKYDEAVKIILEIVEKFMS